MALLRCPSGLYISTAPRMASISSTVRMLGSLRPTLGASNSLLGLASRIPSYTRNLKKERTLEMLLACVRWVTPISLTKLKQSFRMSYETFSICFTLCFSSQYFASLRMSFKQASTEFADNDFSRIRNVLQFSIALSQVIFCNY